MTNGTVTAIALINDALQKLGKARLQLDLAKDLMASTDVELRDLVRTLEVPDGLRS